MRSENNYLASIGTFQDKRTKCNLRNKNFLKAKFEGQIDNNV